MSGRVTHGADVEQLDDIAVALRRQGARISDVGGRGSAHLEKLRALWDGPDFEKFAKEWRAAHRSIDDAESALRTFSRTLAAESEQQRQSSHVSSGGDGPALLGRAPSGVGRPRLEGGPAFERVGEGGPARLEGGPAFQRVEQLPDGLTGLTVDSSDGPVHLASPHGMLVTDTLMHTLPDLPGLEAISADDPGFAQPAAFERMDPGAEPTSSSPPQVPTGDGAHVTTAADSAGQHSVAFDPIGLASQADWGDSSSGSSWLGLDGPDGPDVMPRDQG